MFLVACQKLDTWSRHAPQTSPRASQGLRPFTATGVTQGSALQQRTWPGEDRAKPAWAPASLPVVMDSRGCSGAIFDPVRRQGFPAGKMSL